MAGNNHTNRRIRDAMTPAFAQVASTISARVSARIRYELHGSVPPADNFYARVEVVILDNVEHRIREDGDMVLARVSDQITDPV